MWKVAFSRIFFLKESSLINFQNCWDLEKNGAVHQYYQYGPEGKEIFAFFVFLAKKSSFKVGELWKSKYFNATYNKHNIFLKRMFKWP